MATSQQATQVMNGADILVKSLVDHGVTVADVGVQFFEQRSTALDEVALLLNLDVGQGEIAAQHFTVRPELLTHGGEKHLQHRCTVLIGHRVALVDAPVRPFHLHP